MGLQRKFRLDGPESSAAVIVLAHGAGAPMDSPAMTAITGALAAEELRVARFEFAYMASRRTSFGGWPPPRAETLLPEFKAAIRDLETEKPVIIGGKSMGGRVASMVADELYAAGKIAGLLCFGYPFHPPGKPEQLRTAHLAGLRTPTLICQGTRDVFGNREEVSGYALSDKVEILWLEDGDHDLKPRKGVSGYSAADHLKTIAAKVKAWASKVIN